MSVSRRLAMTALACYPPSFRERYGAEMAGLIEDTDVTARTVADLAAGAVRAWSRSVVPREGSERVRRRLQASVTTTWVAWCAGFLVAPAIDRALLDPPPAHVPALVPLLLSVGLIATLVSAVLVGIAGIPLLARILLTGGRRDRHGIVGPLLPAAILFPLVTLGLIGIVSWRRSYPPLAEHPQFSPTFVFASLLWLAGFLALLVSAGLGPALATTRAAPPVRVLRGAGLLALPVAVLLAVATTASVTATVLMAATGVAGGAAIAFVSAILATGVCASVAAVVSAGRGARFALPRGR